MDTIVRYVGSAVMETSKTNAQKTNLMALPKAGGLYQTNSDKVHPFKDNKYSNIKFCYIWLILQNCKLI